MGGTALAFEISPFGHFQFFMVDSSEITSNITRKVCIRRYWPFSSFVVDSSEITSNRTRQVCIRIAWNKTAITFDPDMLQTWAWCYFNHNNLDKPPMCLSLISEFIKHALFLYPSGSKIGQKCPNFGLCYYTVQELFS